MSTRVRVSIIPQHERQTKKSKEMQVQVGIELNVVSLGRGGVLKLLQILGKGALKLSKV